MFDEEVEKRITAPQFDRQHRMIERRLNGTLLTFDVDIRLFEEIEGILRTIPACGDDEQRGFWFPLPRGTFEEYIHDRYRDEELSDEEIEEARDWFQAD